MRAALYCRVSTLDQAKSGYSIPDQLRECHKKALALGATTVDEYVDNETGAFLDRPGLEQMRQKLRLRYYNCVITKCPDRLSRDVKDQIVLREEIIRSGAELVFLSFEWENTPEGRLFLNVQGIISEYEREIIRARTMAGMRNKILAGNILRNGHLYGYTFVGDKKNRTATYVINEEEAGVVRLIYHWFLHGDGSNGPMGGIAIAKKLADTGIRPPHRAGDSWAKATIYKILKNVTYTGVSYHFQTRKRKVSPHTYEMTRLPEENWLGVPVPVIVDPDTFGAAQRQLRSNTVKCKRNTGEKYLLQGLIHCAVCGRRMAIQPARPGRSPAYYICPSERPGDRRYYADQSLQPERRCAARSVPVQMLDAQVWLYTEGLTMVAKALTLTG